MTNQLLSAPRRTIPFLSFRTIAIQLVVVTGILFAFQTQSTVNATPNVSASSVSSASSANIQEDWIQNQLGDGLDTRDEIASQVVTEQFTKQVSSIEWLAPLAPVALSPFFGITMLSGLACFGPEWLPDNALLSDGSPLANPNLFWLFLVLTVITSAPRFSKVSKPVAQMADFLETYSAIVILLILKLMSMDSFASDTPATAAFVGHQAGILSAGWEGLLMIAMVINIIVVNSVKFFFEILVWITPIPFLDACFEAANKSLCAGLMAIYAYSPFIALIINVALFVVCAFAFTWVRRREIFYRNMLFDWVMKLLDKSATKLPGQIVAFPKDNIGSIPARAKCLVEKTPNGLKLTHQRMVRGHAIEEIAGDGELDSGWFTNSIVLSNGQRLTLSSKYEKLMPELAENLGVNFNDATEKPDIQSGRQVEFA